MRTILAAIRLSFAIALVSLPLISGCSRHEAAVDPSDPDIPGAPPAGTQYLALYRAGLDPLEIVQQQNLTLIDYQSAARLMLFEAPQGFAPDPFDSWSTNDPTEWTRPVNDLITFVEWETLNGDLTGQDALQCLNLSSAHGYGTGAGSRVAVLDTRVDRTHLVLAGHMETVTNPYLGSPYLLPGDSGPALGHGTYVAGLILSVAPDATIIPIPVIEPDGFGTDYELAVGLSAARSLGVDVVNLSLTMSGTDDVVAALLGFLDADGVVVVAAAGNNLPGNQPGYPATDGVTIAVAATDSDVCDELATFSARDGVLVDFGAPGIEVVGPFPGKDASGDPMLVSADGTSGACAVVSGCVALVNGATNPPAGPADPIKALQWEAVPLATSGQVVWGRVAPDASLEYLTQ